MFAQREGAVAAPTAALHFTPDLISRLTEAGLATETPTLHVGAGTFLPVKAEATDDPRMHAEWGRIDTAAGERPNSTRQGGRRSIHVDGKRAVSGQLVSVLVNISGRRIITTKI